MLSKHIWRKYSSLDRVRDNHNDEPRSILFLMLTINQGLVSQSISNLGSVSFNHSVLAEILTKAEQMKSLTSPNLAMHFEAHQVWE